MACRAPPHRSAAGQADGMRAPFQQGGSTRSAPLQADGMRDVDDEHPPHEALLAQA